MPNYEYKCTQDGSTFELWQEVGSPAPPCPDCGAPTKKVFSPTRVIFKGSGFYVTDLRAESQGAKTETAKAEAAKAETAAAPATDPAGEAAPAASETAPAAPKADAAPAKPNTTTND